MYTFIYTHIQMDTIPDDITPCSRMRVRNKNIDYITDKNTELHSRNQIENFIAEKSLISLNTNINITALKA